MGDRRPCQFFLRGSCRFGNNCRDYHPNGSIFGQGMNNGSGGGLGTSSGFGTGGVQFNPFSGFSNKSSSDVNTSPLGNYGGPFGGAGAGTRGVSGFGSTASGSGPFGTLTAGTGTTFGSTASGSSPFGSTMGTGFGSTLSGSSPFGSTMSGSGPFGSTAGTGLGLGGGFESGSGPFGSTNTTTTTTTTAAAAATATVTSTPAPSATGGGLGSSQFGSIVGAGVGTGFGSSPFGSGPFGSSSSSSSSSDGKPSKSDNPMLQTVELIGVVVNSGVWPFGRIGLLISQHQEASQGQVPVFPSLDLSIEEYRWKFYQNDLSSWGKLHTETLSLLTQQYKTFIEQGKMQSKLPPTHRLYDLDFSLYSKIGNWYLPNLGKDFANSKSSNAAGAGTLGSTIGSSPFGGGNNTFPKSPFEQTGNSEGSSNIGFGIPALSSSVNSGTPFGGGGVVNTSLNTANTSPFQAFGENNSIKTGQSFPTASTSIFGNVTNSPQSLHPEGAGKKYSSSNPDVNDDNLLGCQSLQDWEIQAFQGPAFEENKIPEKIPPKHLRT